MTKIEWTRGADGSMGETWNPVVGCSRVSEGCRHCYAERQAFRNGEMGHERYRGLTHKVGGEIRWTGVVRLVPEALDKPLRWKKPRKVFVNSMSDLFHESLKDEDIDKVFAVMALAPLHTFQVLTKRPERMRDYMLERWQPGEGETVGEDRHDQVMFGAERILIGPWGEHERFWTKDEGMVCHQQPWPLPNVWLGVSVEDQATADERIPLLLQTPAAVRWVSAEPLLGHVDLRQWLRRRGHESGRDGVPGAGGARHVHGGCRGAAVAPQGLDEGEPHRVGAGTGAAEGAASCGCQPFGGPVGPADQVSARDVRREGSPLERARASRGLDDDERRAYPAGPGDQPQERQRRGQQASQSRGGDGFGERDARDPAARSASEGPPRDRQRAGEAHRRASDSDSQARGVEVDAAVEDRAAVRRRSADGLEHSQRQDLETPGLDWVVVGGESGPGARPFDLAWARSTVAQCKAAGVPMFYKQGGSSNRCAHSSKGGHFECFPDDLKIREFPRAA